jgi:ABC-type antimicrobial peptide transport system permease subunit
MKFNSAHGLGRWRIMRWNFVRDKTVNIIQITVIIIGTTIDITIIFCSFFKLIV